MTKPVLGYRSIHGRTQPHRLLLKYLSVEFEDKLYDFGSGPEPTSASWSADEKNLGFDFPNLPYWIDDTVKITEPKAILKYIAKTRGPALVPETPELQAIIDMVEGVATELQLALVRLAHTKPGMPKSPLEEFLAPGPKFKQLDEYLSNRAWAAGENISYVDFYLYDVLKQFTKFESEFLTPALTGYVQKFEALPQLEEFIKSTELTLN